MHHGTYSRSPSGPPSKLDCHPARCSRTEPCILPRATSTVVSKNQHYSLCHQARSTKKFRSLGPQGFCDAVIAYGLPSTVCDLDISTQSNVPLSLQNRIRSNGPGHHICLHQTRWPPLASQVHISRSIR
ncbi:hypothetical protein BV22DRAFT_866436 [Leucogyrophana mollusca]|uniref:Uncharacterized protein n=1 Tax=Leucogyrophana mollusca TaxID=85980 RepID=A0ACB8B3N2_9AGAM|nr:hypothetical protein BV22DRAFT_866436 [Leucogyrophana mollusca]